MNTYFLFIVLIQVNVVETLTVNHLLPLEKHQNLLFLMLQQRVLLYCSYAHKEDFFFNGSSVHCLLKIMILNFLLPHSGHTMFPEAGNRKCCRCPLCKKFPRVLKILSQPMELQSRFCQLILNAKTYPNRWTTLRL